MATLLKRWREAATLVLAARMRKPQLGSCDYQLLMLQRHQRSKFMPDNYVFPGGVIETEADFASQWAELFEKSNRTLTRFTDIRGPRPPMFSKTRGASEIPNEVAFRICAIRETFEESGILLVTDPSTVADEGDKDILKLSTSTTDKILSKICKRELEDWRRRVHDNASEFIELCRQLNCVPNIWALTEWSDWLTPSDVKPRRYDTVFYVCCVDDIPSAAVDDQEVVNLKWLTPSEALAAHMSEKIILGPPQLYEVSRIRNFKSLDDLHGYSVARGDKGLDLWLPVRINAKDGVLSVLPGDSLYPEKPDFVGDKDVESIDQTMLESRCSSTCLHRAEVKSIFKVRFFCNIDLPYGQITPVTSALDDIERKSKL
ncbi:acyl-coenzyme A diphosphatase NUDT19-like [Ptychodera flava]|uniref:acyl-coenzyme A diphosphatase NUDT19-like n=1 Tax=Ptychodera flava TaxID=63121 RepID=UPI00396A2F4C